MDYKSALFLLCFCELNVFAYHIPVHFIVAVDTTASMARAVEQVNSAMNGLFTAVSAFTDIRVIVIADNSVCIALPLGSGSCTNDTKLPDYAHIYQAVGSRNSLEIFNQTFALWSPLVSGGDNTSLVVLCVVSDDDTRTNAEQFLTNLRALSDSIAQRFRFYAVTRATPGVILPNCASSSPASAEYQKLVTLTQGYITEICSISSATFADIATALYQHTFVNDSTTDASTTSLTTAISSTTTSTTTTTSSTAVSSTPTAASSATSTTSVSTTDAATTTGATGATTTGATSSSTDMITTGVTEDASGGASIGLCVAYIIVSMLIQAMI